ncbi:hypothetical protein [Paenibacillus sp.]|uniref:hypothetical protein n=1 Tax=Paenibacillus sp. TaxID=58172 RepID=UPI002D706BEF|nr:hypothetical protein [Paenibacillus sp.]HZG88198.1 hypothetical protein [Paenibacillus sp.]
MDYEANYGKYAVPSMLTQLVELQSQMKHPHGHLLHLYFGLDDVTSRYFMTPVDGIGFARPGADGIHYCFLTDFGVAASLEDAYIVRVSPMDFGDPVRIVARNLKEFLRLLCFRPVAADLLDTRVSREQYERWNEEYPGWEGTRDDISREAARRVIERFSLEPVGDDLYSYYQELGRERAAAVVAATKDSIGVVPVRQGATADEAGGPLEAGDHVDWAEVRERFPRLSMERRLAWIRDMQSLGAFYNHDEGRAWTQAQLAEAGFADEAVRIAYPERPKPQPRQQAWATLRLSWKSTKSQS